MRDDAGGDVKAGIVQIKSTIRFCLNNMNRIGKGGCLFVSMALMTWPMVRLQDEGNEEEIGNGFDFEEEDVRAHSTRAEDFNFSEFII